MYIYIVTPYGSKHWNVILKKKTESLITLCRMASVLKCMFACKYVCTKNEKKINKCINANINISDNTTNIVACHCCRNNSIPSSSATSGDLM
jgi:hypothetical protein